MTCIADLTRAWRSDTYRWETELEGLNSGYMSSAAVADAVTGYGQNSILLRVEVVPMGLDFKAPSHSTGPPAGRM